MLTIEQIESVCDDPRSSSLPHQMVESSALPLRAVFYPFGFPAEVRTNSHAVLEQYGELWGKFQHQQNAPPVRCDVQLVESDAVDCPPAPTYRLGLPFMVCVADRDNYCIVDLERSHARIVLSQAALRHPLYAQYFLLGVPACCIATGLATPVHAGCVTLNGRGVLLCGDSGAGKSTLSYACARAGWTYITDDASYVLNGGAGRIVTGNCHQVRFRPSAASLFPELEGCDITPRAAGKPSIELPTAPMTHITPAQTAAVDFIVFLNRRTPGPPQLVPYRKDVARRFMRQILYGPEESLARQYESIEKLLSAEIFELRYHDLSWAIDRLQILVTEGQ